MDSDVQCQILIAKFLNSVRNSTLITISPPNRKMPQNNNLLGNVSDKPKSSWHKFKLTTLFFAYIVTYLLKVHILSVSNENLEISQHISGKFPPSRIIVYDDSLDIENRRDLFKN